MKLLGNRIKLSLLDESDLDLFLELSMSPVMMEYVGEPCSLEEANEAFFAKSQPWSIESEGCLKQNMMINGKYIDDYIYGLCRSP